jgi:hypothetical protein
MSIDLLRWLGAADLSLQPELLPERERKDLLGLLQWITGGRELELHLRHAEPADWGGGDTAEQRL